MKSKNDVVCRMLIIVKTDDNLPVIKFRRYFGSNFKQNLFLWLTVCIIKNC